MLSADLFEINGAQTIPRIEQQLSELQDRRPQGLLLPVNLKESWIGGQASLIQLIITWGKMNADATLVTHIKSDEEPTIQLSKLAKRPFGFSAIWMANSIKDRALIKDLKVVANRCTESQFDLMWRGAVRREAVNQPSLFGDDDLEEYVIPGVTGSGAQVFLASVDHDRWLLPQCYFANEKLRERDDFTALARLCFQRAFKSAQHIPVPPSLFAPFGAIFHELFKNTHQHARKDIDGAFLRRSVRGMIVNRRSWSKESVNAVVHESPPLKDFTDDLLKNSAANESLELLEISVFDSGIGLAAHWLKGKWNQETTIITELKACQDCMKQWATSTNLPHKGEGLFEVAQVLSQLGGFMRLRTGRLSLYRNYRANPCTQNEAESVRLFDWNSQSIQPTKMAEVAGVLFTMFIPVIKD